MLDVDESDARASGEVEGCDSGAVDVNREIDEGRSITFFVRHYSQPRHAILNEAFVAEAFELAVAGDAGQARVELIQIERLMEKALKPAL